MEIKERKKLRRAIRRLVIAEINRSWMGSQHPDDYSFIIQELKQSKQALHKLLRSL
jgi:ribosomal protein L20